MSLLRLPKSSGDKEGRFPLNVLFTSASGELWKMVRIGGQPLGFAHRYHPCSDLGGRRRTHIVLRRVCHQPTAFSHTADSPCSHQGPTASEDNAALGQLTGKPTGTWQGSLVHGEQEHPCRPSPPPPQVVLGQLSAVPWELPSSVGKGIAWT
ncbi:UNVERIFIED_CONTAM: hypothetical protein FKN15_014864 [Acipenser sinensis]